MNSLNQSLAAELQAFQRGGVGALVAELALVPS